MVLHSRANQELEENGEDELTVAAVRYTGPRSIFNSSSLQLQGYWPGKPSLQGRHGEPGPWNVAMVPSKRLGYYENHNDLEIAYDRETIATAFLERNSLPNHVFGDEVHQLIQDRVLDLLEIERLPRRIEAIREDLAEIAGVDQDAGEEAEAESFPYDDLTRSDLWSISKPLDPPFDWNGMRTTEAEDFLLEQDESQVRHLVQQLQNGQDPSLPEADDAVDDDGDDTADTADSDGGEGGEEA